MPHSSKILDNVITEVVKAISPRACLDIGAGSGKFGIISRKYLPACRMTAIEVEKDYISKFKLHNIYDEVRNEEAMSILHKDINHEYDLVIFGDSIEHLKKSDGLDLLNFLIYRAKYIMIIYPIKYLQNEVDGYKSEAHVSVWSCNDFDGMNGIFAVQENLMLVVLEGYLAQEDKLKQIRQILHRHNLMIKSFVS